MDFAKKQLEKYGWREGKGLGKDENGISTPIKSSLKFDKSGMGFEVGEQFTNNWWEKAFNSAAANINVEVDKTKGVSMKVKDRDIEITTKSYSVKDFKKNKNMEYGSFLKTSKLTENGVEDYGVEVAGRSDEPLKSFKALTDEELFAACGGRTAHKGARHGLKLGGKLLQIEKQEKMLLKKMKKVSISEENNQKVEKKLKKLRKQKDVTERYTPIIEEGANSPPKPKNKKRKSVSFNETVTEIYAPDLDTSFDSELGVISENSNEALAMDNTNNCDEGIEQDIEISANFAEIEDNKTFEVAQLTVSDLSKAERKKLKKKRKQEEKLNSSTNKFLAQLNEKAVILNEDLSSKKRKKIFEDIHRGAEKVSKKRQQSQSTLPSRLTSKKQRKLEEKQLKSITKSLDSFCRISDCE